ncbi:hypothetical protein [Kitasatospora sp. NPDC101183]|uniref:hypothetical protein n=1 Tax=Kitasatospora sp. NPDC101183 TaxID=3364100 RepID=UPI00381F1695
MFTFVLRRDWPGMPDVVTYTSWWPSVAQVQAAARIRLMTVCGATSAEIVNAERVVIQVLTRDDVSSPAPIWREER